MIYLASKSPRRKALLAQIGIEFDLIDGEVDEYVFDNELGRDYCLRVAKSKALAGWTNSNRKHDWPVLGADTTVVCDNTILTKPVDEQDAVSMLTLLNDRTHQVYTAVAIVFNEITKTVVCQTDVTFGHMSEQEMVAYSHSGESLGRAGGYSIQGMISQYIKHMSGSYTNVVGLPLYETAQLLKQF